MNQRGQTAYDYLIGVTLLLVTIIVVLSLVPQVFNPFVDPISTDREKMADRVANELIETNATEGSEQTLHIDSISVESLQSRAGLNEYRSVNISFQDKDGTVIRSYGDQQVGSRPSATSVRTVSIVNEPACELGCQLVVRVW
jgi:hypothetical protein